MGEPNKDKNSRDDNKRTRTGNAFATTVNPIGRENTCTWPKCTTCNSYHAPGGPCRTCFNCNRPNHLAKNCRGVMRNVNPVNARNPIVRACYECDSTDHVRAFMLGAEEARQDPNIVTGTFTLNDHFATTLFDSGADYSFVSTTFIPLLGLEPSDLEIEGHVFDIDLIPFGHGSFDMIIGMDWLSNYKAEIICREKVVRIPLPNGKVLRVVGERSEEKARLLWIEIFLRVYEQAKTLTKLIGRVKKLTTLNGSKWRFLVRVALRRVLWLLPWTPWFLNTPWDFYTSSSARLEQSFEVEGDGEVRVMTRGFGDLVAKLGDKVVMEVLVRCWSDGDVVVRSW
ncbi:putative reverse transcriptase domain-containing protein [Tanacetum coccineum]|uniref:Reverse transcriptase domain-containing protein n=1 Tax=Tanacetum coccineum TaxID=301880 RepID=A0ABQ5FTR3_9ASTR